MQILCATDLLQKSEAAIQRAGLLANELRAELQLLHVVSPAESQQALEETLLAAMARTRSREAPLLWNTHRAANVGVRVGNPARVILDAAAQSQTSLLVLGPHRLRPVRNALEGTIAEKALATQRYPVLVVRGEAQAPYRRVLLALDYSEASVAAMRATEALVLNDDVDATVVHAHRPPYQGMLHYADVAPDSVTRYAEAWRRGAHGSMRQLLEQHSADASRYDVHVEQRPAAAGILRAVERYSPELLVMGTRGGGRLRRALLGSVANRVLHGTTCDVLIVPEGSSGAHNQEVENVAMVNG